MAGPGKDGTVRVKKPLGINTRVLDWQVIKQCRHLIISYNRGLGHLFSGLVQKPTDSRQIMGSFLLPGLHLSNVK